MKIILLSGATGVGTTSVATAMAKQLGLQNVLCTDAIREAARQLVPVTINPYLHRSSYLAGQSPNYGSKSEEVQREDILRGFKDQSRVVQLCVEGIVSRYQKENTPMIVEGVNLIPGNYPLNKDIKHILIDIEDEDLHVSRLRERIAKSPDRGASYLQYIKEIRWLRDYLKRKAYESHITIEDNSRSLEDAVKDCLDLTR